MLVTSMSAQMNPRHGKVGGKAVIEGIMIKSADCYSVAIRNANRAIEVINAPFPLLAGLGYEFIRYAGENDNLVVRIISAPGLWIQRITTKEPDSAQIEVAIAALKSILSTEPQPETVQRSALKAITDQ